MLQLSSLELGPIFFCHPEFSNLVLVLRLVTAGSQRVRQAIVWIPLQNGQL